MVPTRHAAERWRERVDAEAPPGVPEFALGRLDRSGIAVPFRLARKHWLGRGPGRLGRRLGYRFLFTPRALGVCQGETVITVLATDVEDLATVLVWLMTRWWLEEEDPA